MKYLFSAKFDIVVWFNSYEFNYSKAKKYLMNKRGELYVLVWGV